MIAPHQVAQKTGEHRASSRSQRMISTQGSSHPFHKVNRCRLSTFRSLCSGTMPTIFITGASGYIGGHTVDFIAKAHPEWEVVTLVRTKEHASMVRKRWAAIMAVVGNLDDHSLVSQLGASADVVLRMCTFGLKLPCLYLQLVLLTLP